MDSGGGWMILFGAFLSRLIDSGLSKSLGVLLPTLTEQFNIMVWRAGNTISLMGIVGAFVVVLVSPLLKTVYPRYLLLASGLLPASGFILASFANNWTTMSLFLILTGVGTRCSMTFTISLVPDYYDQYLTFACGLAYAGGPVGTMICAPMAQWWLDMFGWRGTFLLLGSVAFNILLCGAVVNPQIKPSKINEMKENKDANTFSCGILKTIIKCFELEIFKDFKFISLMLSDFSICIAWQAWIIYLVPHAEDKGLTPYQATTVATAGGAGFFAGLLIPASIIDTGILADDYVRFSSLIITGTTFALDPWINSFPGLIVLSVLCATAIGVCFITSMSLAANIADAKNIGQVVAFSMFVSAAGKYTGGIVTGLLFDLFKSYDISFLFVAGSQFAAALIQGMAIIFERGFQEAMK